jgi:glucose-fructose oxidoreductase
MGPAYGYSGQKGWTSDPKVPFEFPPSDHFVLEIDAFSEAILNGKAFAVTGEEGLKDLLAVEAIYKSIASGKSEKVEPI